MYLFELVILSVEKDLAPLLYFKSSFSTEIGNPGGQDGQGKSLSGRVEMTQDAALTPRRWERLKTHIFS